MSKSKIVGMMALITFALGILLVANTMAGEKIKVREVSYVTKWEQINVGEEEGHVIALFEAKGIQSNKEGKTFCEGWLHRETGVFDINPKTGMTSIGYITLTDRDGDKVFLKWDVRPSRTNEWTFFKGTGKFEGIKGKGTFSSTHTSDPSLFYVDWEGEVELRR